MREINPVSLLFRADAPCATRLSVRIYEKENGELGARLNVGEDIAIFIEDVPATLEFAAAHNIPVADARAEE